MLDPAPDLHRRDRPAQPATSRCSRAPCCRAARSSAAGCEIGPDTRLVDCVVGAGAFVEHTVATDAEIGEGARVGPYAVLQPGSLVAAWSVTGPFYTGTVVTLGAGDARSDWRSTPERAHPALAEEIADHLDVDLGDPAWSTFANGEVRARFAESIRGADVFIIQSHYGCDGRSINDSIMEQLIMIDAAHRASAKRITAVCPFYGYARQDRKADGREPITARLVANMFKAAGAKRMVSRRPALRPDPGLLRRPGRPPDGHAGAGGLHPQAQRRPGDRVARRRSGEGGRALSPSTSDTPTWPSSTSAGPRAWTTWPWPRRSSATSRAASA